MTTAIAVDVHQDYQRLGASRRVDTCGLCRFGMLEVIGLDFDGAYGASHGVHIGGVVHGFHRGQTLGQLGEREAAKTVAQRLIDRHFGQSQAAEYRLEVHTRAAAQYGIAAAAPDVGVGCVVVLQIAVEIVFFARIGDVYQVIGRITVFVKVFARADVHIAVHLTRIGADNLGIEVPRKRHGTPRLAARRRTGNTEIMWNVECRM